MGRRTRLKRKILEASAKGFPPDLLEVLHKSNLLTTEVLEKLSASSCKPSNSTKYSQRELQRTKHTSKKQCRPKKGGKSKFLDLNFCDAAGWTPLHHAALSGDIKCVQILLFCGANMNKSDNNGRTAAHVATSKRYFNVVAILKDHGADFNAADVNGITVNRILTDQLQAVRETINAKETMKEEREGRKESLWESASEEEGNWGGWENEEEEEDEEEKWKDEIAASMRKRQREQEEAIRKAAQEAVRRHFEASGKQSTEEETKQETETRRNESQRILREEQEKDRKWRENVSAGKFLAASLRYREAWKTFHASSNFGIVYEDVPFPVSSGKESNLRKIILHSAVGEVQRKVVRSELMKWHPDKFIQRWGLRLSDADREKILNRVKEIFQVLQEIYADLQGKNKFVD